MKITKEGAKLIFEVPGMKYGLEYNLTDHIFYSLANNKPYKNQMGLLKLPAPVVKAYNDTYKRFWITSLSNLNEVEGIILILAEQPSFREDEATVIRRRQFKIDLFQMLKSGEVDLRFNTFHNIVQYTPEEHQTHKLAVKYARFIKQYIAEKGTFDIDPHNVFLVVNTQTLGELPPRITSTIRELYTEQVLDTPEKIDFIIRKEQSEGLSYIFNNYTSLRVVIRDYFALCETMKYNWRQKNFVKTYSYLRQLSEAKQEELTKKLKENVQGDKFKFSYNGFNAYLPQTQSHFIELGRDFRNCVAGYYDRAMRGQVIIVAFYKDGEPRICTDIRVSDGDFQINSFLRPMNSRILSPDECELQKEYTKYLRTIEL